MARKKLTPLQVFLETKRIEAAEAQTVDDRTALRQIIGPYYSANIVIDNVIHEIKTTAYEDTYIVINK